MNRQERRRLKRQGGRAADPATAGELSRLAATTNSLIREGRFKDAFVSAVEMTRHAPELGDAHRAAGFCARRLGNHREAVRFLRKAVALRPEDAEGHAELGRALAALGRHDAALASLRKAVALAPDRAAFHNAIGVIALEAGRPADAAEAYAHAIRAAPEAGALYRNHGIALHRLGRLDEAIEEFRLALAKTPDWPLIGSNLVMALMEAERSEEAVAACQEWLDAVPGSTEATARLALALIAADRRADARGLLDFERLVWITDIDAPEGYGDLAAFNQALARHVLAHPTLAVPPKDDPTYHNPHLHITQELFAEPKGPMADLEHLIHAAIDAYRERLSAMVDHPFVRHWPAKWRLTCWATLLSGQGNLEPHIHLDGYLGGVYYPELPDAMKAAAAGESGWFEVGRPPPEMASKATPETMTIEPREGRLLLFPGYFYHRTVPFEAPGRRISIAFDLVAAP